MFFSCEGGVGIGAALGRDSLLAAIINDVICIDKHGFRRATKCGGLAK
jgi:hypothetical protein